MFADNSSPPDPLGEITEGGHRRQFPGIHRLIRPSPIAEGLPCVKADPTQMRQVVMNLISNASEAIGAYRGGESR